MSGSGRFSSSAYVLLSAPSTVSTRLKRAEQDEETAQPKLFYSKVRTPRRETYGGAAVNADR